MAPSLVILCKTEINSFFSTILCSSEFASMSCFNCKNYFCQGKLDWIAHFLSPLDLRGEKRRGRDVFEAEQWKEERAGPSWLHRGDLNLAAQTTLLQPPQGHTHLQTIIATPPHMILQQNTSPSFSNWSAQRNSEIWNNDPVQTHSFLSVDSKPLLECSHAITLLLGRTWFL